MERTLAQDPKPAPVPQRFVVIALPIAKNEESAVQTTSNTGSSILGRKLAQFYTVYHFALIRVSDRKELHFAARYSDLRNWYLELRHCGALKDEVVGVPFPSKQSAIAAVAAFFGSSRQHSGHSNSLGEKATNQSLSPARPRSVGILPRRFVSPSRDDSPKRASSPLRRRGQTVNIANPLTASSGIPIGANPSSVDSGNSGRYSPSCSNERPASSGSSSGNVHIREGNTHGSNTEDNSDYGSKGYVGAGIDGIANESLDEQRRRSVGAWLNALLVAYPNILRSSAVSNFLTAKRCSSPAEDAARAAAQAAAASQAASFAFEPDDFRHPISGNESTLLNSFVEGGNVDVNGSVEGVEACSDSADDDAVEIRSFLGEASRRGAGLRGVAAAAEALTAKTRLEAETWTLNVKSVVDNVRRGVDTSASVFDWPLEPSYSTSNTEMLEKKGRLQFSDDPDDEVVGRVGRETSLLDTHRPNPKDVRNLNAPADKLEAHAKEQLMEIRRASSLAALPAFSQDMGCFLIKLEDLELEAKPFASGGSGRVYRGVYGGSPVAAKVISSQENAECRDEFDREFAALATLHHPNIVAFFGVARDLSLGVLYTVTEFCAGGNLADVLAQSSSSLRKNAIEARSSLRWSPQLMNNIVEGLFAAVSYMHANNRAHRDLKPMNVLLTADGKVKLCDMGICTECDRGKGSHRLTSKAWSADHDDDDEMFTRGVGTLPYMPPEAFAEHNTDAAVAPTSSPADNGAAPYDPRAWDAYSLGIMLWELWYCESPWEGRSFHQIVRRVSKGKRPSPLSHQNRGRSRVKNRTKAEGNDDDDFKASLSPVRSLSPVPQPTPPPKLPMPFARKLPASLETLWTSLWAQAPGGRPSITDAAATFKSTVSPLLRGKGGNDEGTNDESSGDHDSWVRFTIAESVSSPSLPNGGDDEGSEGTSSKLQPDLESTTKVDSASSFSTGGDWGANELSGHVYSTKVGTINDESSTVSLDNTSGTEGIPDHLHLHELQSRDVQRAGFPKLKNPFPSPDGLHAIEAFLTEECSLKPAQITTLRDKYETLAALLLAVPEFDDDAATVQGLSPSDASNLQVACRHRIARQTVWGTNAPMGDVTFVFANIQGSTRLWERFGPSFKSVFDCYRRVLRSALSAHDGYEVKTDGGAFMVAFGSAANAISFACQIQVDLLDASYPASFLEAARTDASLKKDLGEVALRKVSHELHVASDGTTSTAELGEDISGVQVEAGMSEKEGLEANGAAVSGTEGSGGVDSEAKKSTWLWRGVRVRVGCFTGDPEVERDETTGRVDYYGNAVNRAARVVEQATGGQVLMSAGTHFHLSKEALTIFKAQQLMENISIVDLGPRRIRDSAEPEQLFQVLPSFLASRFALSASQLSTNSATTAATATTRRGRDLVRTPPIRGKGSKSPVRTRIGSVERFDAIYAWASRRKKAGGGISENIVSV